jgi:hypothetical protein
VAIESVGFDFLYYEFDENHPTEGKYDAADNHGPFSRYAGADDFLHQAADSKNWPQGFTYDPENDGTPLPSSMGTHEHWNNALEKKYSRNLGLDKGVDLVTNVQTSVLGKDAAPGGFSLDQNFPNPFNPSTVIRYRLPAASDVVLVLYNARGEKIRTLVSGFRGAGPREETWDGLADDGRPAPAGVYFCRITAGGHGQITSRSNKMVLCR